MSKIAVGLSGGVDSATTIALLKSKGHDVQGLTMKIWDKSPKEIRHACFGADKESDLLVCERITKQLNVPYSVVDISEEFKTEILDYFRNEYLSGRTPNPCVMCNQRIKFGALLKKAREIGLEFDYFATGHYANTEIVGEHTYLKAASDSKKDQSYFLYRIPQEILRQVIFPLGGFSKPEVRKLAQNFNLEVADKADSQDFVANGDYTVLFDKTTPGQIVDESGKYLGEHQGIIHYTIGQRRGLGLSFPVPLFVKEIIAEKNQIVVTPNEKLFKDRLEARHAFLHGFPSRYDSPVYAKIRNNHVPAQVQNLSFNADKKMISIQFCDPQRGVTPGQSLVLYQDGYVVGGGEIS